MWYSGYNSDMWIFGALMMLLFWGGITALVVLLVRSLMRSQPRRIDEALETLRKRFAAGEIGQEEFERSRKVLQG